MLGLPRRASIALVGWLWADILLGLMALFLAANSAGTAVQASHAIRADPITIEMNIQGSTLLTETGAPVEREQQRIADAAQSQLDQKAKGKRVAIVLAYARHQSPDQGDKLATLATADLTKGAFADAVIKTFHELDAGNAGTHLTLEVYVYE